MKFKTRKNKQTLDHSFNWWLSVTEREERHVISAIRRENKFICFRGKTRRYVSTSAE